MAQNPFGSADVVTTRRSSKHRRAIARSGRRFSRPRAEGLHDFTATGYGKVVAHRQALAGGLHGRGALTVESSQQLSSTSPSGGLLAGADGRRKKPMGYFRARTWLKEPSESGHRDCPVGTRRASRRSLDDRCRFIGAIGARSLAGFATEVFARPGGLPL